MADYRICINQRDQCITVDDTTISIIDIPLNNKRFQKCLEFFDAFAYGHSGRTFRLPSLPCYDAEIKPLNYYYAMKKISALESVVAYLDKLWEETEYPDEPCYIELPDDDDDITFIKAEDYDDDNQKFDPSRNLMDRIKREDKELYHDIIEAERRLAKYGETKRRERAPRPKYNAKLNDAYKREYGDFGRYLFELVDTLRINDYESYPVKPRRVGRPEYSMKDYLFCCIDRIHRGLTSRAYVSEAEKIAFDKHYITHCPSDTRCLEILANEKLTPILQALLQISASPMANYETTVAIDSSGFRTTSYGQWFREKWGKEKKTEYKGKKNIWKKAHISIGVKTGVIIAMTVTESEGADTHDVTQFKSLLIDSTKYFDVKECLADKGYISRYNFDLAQEYGIALYIPFRVNCTPEEKGSSAWRKAFFFAKEHPDEFYEHYKYRNNVESTFGAIKEKLGETILSVSRTAQINELYCKAISYNIWTLEKFDTLMGKDNAYANWDV